MPEQPGCSKKAGKQTTTICSASPSWFSLLRFGRIKAIDACILHALQIACEGDSNCSAEAPSTNDGWRCARRLRSGKRLPHHPSRRVSHVINRWQGRLNRAGEAGIVDCEYRVACVQLIAKR